MWVAIAQAVGTLIKGLLDLGHRPSRDDIIAIAKAIARDEYMARVMADELDEMIRAAQGVREAFHPPSSPTVPNLEIDVEIVKP